jgi:hypothetical protein
LNLQLLNFSSKSEERVLISLLEVKSPISGTESVTYPFAFCSCRRSKFWHGEFALFKIFTEIYLLTYFAGPVAVVERSKAWRVFDRSEAVIARSNPALGMDV